MKENYGIIIPTGPSNIKVPKTFFGWACLSMKRWVGIKRYKRITPVRRDLIFDFMFWKFVKSLNKKPKWEWNDK